MKITGYANIYWESPGVFGFEHSIFLYSMAMAADQAAQKSLETNGDRRILGRAIPVEIEIPEKEEGKQ